MLYGKVLRPTAFGATLTALDAEQAQQMPGVTVVRDGNFVGVTAPSHQPAEKRPRGPARHLETNRNPLAMSCSGT